MGVIDDPHPMPPAFHFCYFLTPQFGKVGQSVSGLNMSSPVDDPHVRLQKTQD